MDSVRLLYPTDGLNTPTCSYLIERSCLRGGACRVLLSSAVLRHSCSLVSVACCLLCARIGPAKSGPGGTQCKQQTNGYDCGTFACVFAQKATKDQEPDVSQVTATSSVTPCSMRYTAFNKR